MQTFNHICFPTRWYKLEPKFEKTVPTWLLELVRKNGFFKIFFDLHTLLRCPFSHIYDRCFLSTNNCCDCVRRNIFDISSIFYCRLTLLKLSAFLVFQTECYSCILRTFCLQLLTGCLFHWLTVDRCLMSLTVYTVQLSK